ncbi:MAG: RNA polymerase sigma factor [Mangrovibacterium sp.]
MKTDDHNLWAEFLKGNQLAFISIYDRYVDMLCIYGSKLTTDKELIKDCVQDVFFDLYVKRHTLSKTHNIKFYLLRSFKNSVIRKLTRERRIRELNRTVVTDFQVEYSFESKVIFNETEEEKRRLVERILNKLNHEQKEILFLRFMDGLNYTEISEMTGIRADSVKKQVYRIIKKIRAVLGPKSNFTVILIHAVFRTNSRRRIPSSNPVAGSYNHHFCSSKQIS